VLELVRPTLLAEEEHIRERLKQGPLPKSASCSRAVAWSCLSAPLARFAAAPAGAP